MKKKRLENNPEVQKRLEEHQVIESKDFTKLLRKVIKPSSQKHS